ncbi:hypothetical protein D3C76_1789860 [compost metagenome]
MAKTTAPMMPPTPEAVIEAPSARAACPCLANGCPSRVVAASSPSPGMPNMMLEIWPLVPFTACIVSRKTAPAIMSMP